MASGVVRAPAGLQSFCLAVDRSDAFPEGCSSRTGALNDDGTFSGVSVDGGVPPGTHRLTAWVKDLRGRVASASSTVTVASAENRVVDLATVGLEVTQGVQTFGLPFVGPSRADRSQSYTGVRLAEQYPTIVRLYALSAGSLPRVRNATAALYGFRQGRNGRVALNGGRPLLPLRGPGEIGRFLLNDDIRGDAPAGFDFALPASWTQGFVTLRAEVNPSGLAPAVTECAACRANNVAELRNIGFERTGEVQITPVAMPDDFRHPVPDVGVAFAGLRAVLPISPGRLRIAPYQGAIPIGDIKARLTGDARTGPVFARLAEWEDRNQAPGFTVGVTSGGVRGVAAPVVFAPGIVPPRLGGIETLAVTEADRPLTSVAHEVFHQLGFRHAGFGCDDGSFRQVLTEGWPPDEKGFIQGVGLDRRSQNPFRVLLLNPPTIRSASGRTDFFDLMSHCANEDNAWVSVRSWNRAIRGPRLSQEIGLARRAQAGGPTLRVLARVDRRTGATTIASVRPGAGGTTPPAGDADVEVITRKADGSIAGRAPLRAGTGHSHGTTEQEDVITADVLARDATVVEVVRGGQVVARRVRSASDPTVRLIAPRSGGRIGSGRFVDVRWSASDADGDPLVADISYSSNGGRTFRPLTVGIAGQSARVPASLFGASRHGRVRVTVSDGFRHATATSGPLRATAQAPVVRILSPSGSSAIAADATLVLSGEAYDAEGRRLPASGLRWYRGPRPIGRGSEIAVTGLRAGRGRVSLVARGASGTTGAASVDLRVVPTTPRFLRLSAPRRVSARSRTVAITVATTVTARLTVGGRRIDVDRRARRILVRVRPGDRTLRLPLTLRSASRVARTTLVIARR